jgi:glucose-6-phosphate dehydrogenase assembly protein OpcA
VTTLWDTTGSDVVRAMEAERRSAGALAFGLALTLVVVTDQESVAEAEAAAKAAGSAHPCRILVVIRRHLDAPDPRLDAEVLIGGRLGPGEAVVMRMYGRLALHAESVVLPLLASDAPVVTWWHGATPEKLAYDALGVLASRRVTDATTEGEDAMVALKRRAKDYAPGDTDLAWTRTTPWRALLASAFDDMGEETTSGQVHSEHGNPSAALLAGWLTSRLGVRIKRVDSAGPGITAVELRFTGKSRLRIDRPDGYLATLSRTGISDRQLPLKRRELGELLAEELRRLDADQPYADALAAVTGEKGLDDRPPMRTLVWRDPEMVRRKAAARKAAPKKPAKKTPAAKKLAEKRPADDAVKKATRRKAAVTRTAAAGTKARTGKKVAARRVAAKKRGS